MVSPSPLSSSDSYQRVLGRLNRLKSWEDKGLDAEKILRNSILTERERKIEAEKELQRSLTSRELGALLRAHDIEYGKNIAKGLTLRRDKEGEIFSREETKKIMDAGLAGAFDDVRIEETDQDKTLYRPFRFIGKVFSAPIYWVSQGIFGHRRRILENSFLMPNNPRLGVSTLNITEGLRDVTLQGGVIVNAAIESWIKNNPDKKILVLTDADGSFSKNITLIWEQKDTPSEDPVFHYKKYHYPIRKSDRSNYYSLWRYLALVLSAFDFGVSRIFGKNKAIFATKPTSLGNGLKQTSLQITPGLVNSTLHNGGYIINEALRKWKETHPNATIKRLSNSTEMGVSNTPKAGGYTLSILYEE